MWSQFVPIEIRGMSIITGLILMGVIAIGGLMMRYQAQRVKALEDNLLRLTECLMNLKKVAASLEVYSKTHENSIHTIFSKID